MSCTFLCSVDRYLSDFDAAFVSILTDRGWIAFSHHILVRRVCLPSADVKAARSAHYALNGRSFNRQVVACHFYEELKFAKG